MPDLSNSKVFKTNYAGRELIVEIGKYAEQANGACLVRCGDTAVHVSVCMSETAREGMDFFPLSVDYEEKMFAVGKIPGGFKKREGRASDKAILTSRLIDRPIRPLFPKGIFNDVVVVATALSVDPDISPEPLAMVGSSIALSISDIPWAGPTGSVVVGCVDGEYVINPDVEQRAKSTIHLNLAGTSDAILMIEAGANEVTDEEMVGAIMFGHEEIKKVCAWIEGEIVPAVGKPKKEMEFYHIPEDLDAAVKAYGYDKLYAALDTFDRQERQVKQAEAEAEIVEHFKEIYPDQIREVKDSIYYIVKGIVRAKIFDGVRPDGRKLDEVRPIWCEHGVLPRVHGSAVFTRGQTQALTTCTLGMLGEAQRMEGLDEEEEKRYMHQYNFPGYSTGEAKALRSPGRREIGHGALAERALVPVIPSPDEFPYAIRVVSDIMSSNGSSSMASVCGSTMSLMDAGVPIKAPVAGCAMGLVKDQETGKYVIMTDIQGLEDFLGDMDFKVAGTDNGITAIQMDIKIKGISKEIMLDAIAKAQLARKHILGKMLECIPAVSEELSEYAPKIITFKINPEKIGDVVGKQGKVINKIIEQTGTKIDIEDDGTVCIACYGDVANAKRAKAIVESIAHDPEVGDMFVGVVVRVMSKLGAFVEFAPGKDGMIHISKLSEQRVNQVEDVLNVGDKVKVEIIKIGEKGIDLRLLEKMD
ncbi:MAG: polyribonucleotide nucleotidyltransferase [Clostridia bacterium]|nr:polyribonucleotide nucleotidyltransferase [Clostridia bacterium]MBQ8446299.1 polyribonucleotide nucleotidyltransferase [Clostridia bacterium]